MHLSALADARARRAAAPGRHQRVDGAARVAFGSRGVTDLYQRAPCRLLFPDGEAGEPIQAIVLTTSGGLTGGDRILIEVAVAANADATVVNQAAEKLYRVLPGDDDIRFVTRVAVDDGARAEWLGQEAILFDGTRLRRAFHADVAPSARLLAVESLVLGRTAMGERYRHGLIHDEWRIRRDGRLIWADALHLADGAAEAALPYGFGEAVAAATILYVGADAALHLDAARALVGDDAGGATSFDGLLIVRLLSSDAAAMRRAVTRIAAGLRAAALDLAPRLPAVWHC